MQVKDLAFRKQKVVKIEERKEKKKNVKSFIQLLGNFRAAYSFKLEMRSEKETLMFQLCLSPTQMLQTNLYKPALFSFCIRFLFICFLANPLVFC